MTISILSQSLRTQSTTKTTSAKKPVQEESQQAGLAIESANRKLSKVFLGLYNNPTLNNSYGNTEGLLNEFKQLGTKYKFEVETVSSDTPWLEDTHIIKGDNTRVYTHTDVSDDSYEGGNILTLTNKKGENISLVGENFLLHVGNGDKVAGLKHASKLLNVPANRIIELPQQPADMYFHIDGLMTGLRNGVVGLNSPKLMLEALKAVDTTNLSKLEKLLLDSHIKNTEKELKEHQGTYNKIEQTLTQNGFDVEPLPAYSLGADWQDAVTEVRTAAERKDANDEALKEDLLKNPYIKAFVDEYGEKPMPKELEEEFKNGTDGKTGNKSSIKIEYPKTAFQRKLARAYYHINKNFNTRILFANGIGGVDDTKKGYFITNGDKTFPSVNEAFTKALTSSKKAGITNVELLKHNYPNREGGIQCLTNEIGTPEQK